MEKQAKNGKFYFYIKNGSECVKMIFSLKNPIMSQNNSTWDQIKNPVEKYKYLG